jgi:hypothetical protein
VQVPTVVITFAAAALDVFAGFCGFVAAGSIVDRECRR